MLRFAAARPAAQNARNAHRDLVTAGAVTEGGGVATSLRTDLTLQSSITGKEWGMPHALRVYALLEYDQSLLLRGMLPSLWKEVGAQGV